MIDNKNRQKRICKPFAVPDLSDLYPGSSLEDKLDCFGQVMDLMPGPARQHLVKVIQDLDVYSLDARTQPCQSIDEQSCSHNALFALIAPIRSKTLMGIIDDAPPEFHEHLFLAACQLVWDNQKKQDFTPVTIKETMLQNLAAELLSKSMAHEGGYELLFKLTEYWPTLFTSTEESDREKVEKSIPLLYDSVSLPPPSAVLWYDCPIEAGMAISYIDYAMRWHNSLSRNTQGQSRSAVTDYISNLQKFLSDFPNSPAPFARDWQREFSPWGLNTIFQNDLLREIDKERLYSTFGDACHRLDGTRIGEILQLFCFKVEDFGYNNIGVLYDRERLWTTGLRSMLNLFEINEMRQDGLETILRNCGGFYAFDDVFIAVERPKVIRRDQDGLIHCEDGPAIEFRDGCGKYAWHHGAIPAGFFSKPSTLTTALIESEFNVEKRRVMLEIYGLGRFVEDSGAEIVQSDDYGVLYRKRVNMYREIMQMVKVINKTKEPDGTYRTYFLMVPPDVQSAKQAIAWTFGMNEDEYEPSIET